MKCPNCKSTSLRKNGRPKGRQRYRCKDCGRQFTEPLSTSLVSVAVNDEVSVTDYEYEPTNLAEAPKKGIAILLLDVENLKIDINTEQFLASISEYPLQVKMAFANWKNSSLSKYDAELFERGYQLIHVPEGKNSADAQMMTMGAAIGRQYSDAKAVFVCSSDWLLTHLCNGLQNQGLTVYRVKRQPDNILAVENRNTFEVNHYSLEMATEIPPLEGFVEQIKELLQMEHESINQRISQLSIVANLFQKRQEIDVNTFPKNHLSSTEEKFQIISPENSPTTADVGSSKDDISDDFSPLIFTDKEDTDLADSATENLIDSVAELEQAFVSIIEHIEEQCNQVFIPLNMINSNLTKVFGKNGSRIQQSLKKFGGMKNFLNTSNKFQLKKNQETKQYEVSLSQNLQIISSPEKLEQALLKIVKALTDQAPGSYVCISNIGTEFQKRYGKPIVKTMQNLQLGSKFPDFLKSCNSFNIKKVGQGYQVAIANH